MLAGGGGYQMEPVLRAGTHTEISLNQLSPAPVETILNTYSNFFTIFSPYFLK